MNEIHNHAAWPARLHRVLRALTLSLAVVGTAGAHAQASPITADKGGSYPNRPIRFVVPYAAGGNGDVVARLVATRLSAQLGQQVFIDNRAGVGGNLGAEMAARAAPDGYTLFLGTNTHAINMSLYEKPGFDFAKDFTPISLVSSAPLVLITHPAVEARSTPELISLAKSRPGALNYATGGSGSSAHIIMELFKTTAGVDIVHVPYKGVAQAATDLIAGQVQVMFNSTSTAMDQVRAGRVKALGVSSAQRTPLAPGVPTIAEAGFPGFEATIWQGIFVPTGTPAPIVDRLHRELALLLTSEDVKKQMFQQGVVPTGSTPSQFQTFVKSEVAKWGKVVKASGAKVD